MSRDLKGLVYVLLRGVVAPGDANPTTQQGLLKLDATGFRYACAHTHTRTWSYTHTCAHTGIPPGNFLLNCPRVTKQLKFYRVLFLNKKRKILKAKWKGKALNGD